MSVYVKGKLLEYSLRQVMFRCGFSVVPNDNVFIFERAPLQFINGKGAAHDADVLVEPPIQMPFSYPSRILFECKAYAGNINLPIVRSASALRQDINDFEIVTENFLQARQNNRRAVLAIHQRKRHFYQVGVASIFGFTKPAIEFAANNKIPLFSLQEAFRGSQLLDILGQIPQDIEHELGPGLFTELKRLLSDKVTPLQRQNRFVDNFAAHPTIIAFITELFNHLERVHVGVLESGELIFITKDLDFDDEVFAGEDVLNNIKGSYITTRIHWERNNPNIWSLEFPANPVVSYSFYLPQSIAVNWASFEELKPAALNIKNERFSRIFVFSKPQQPLQLPFNILTLDQAWMHQLRIELLDNDAI